MTRLLAVDGMAVHDGGALRAELCAANRRSLRVQKKRPVLCAFLLSCISCVSPTLSVWVLAIGALLACRANLASANQDQPAATQTDVPETVDETTPEEDDESDKLPTIDQMVLPSFQSLREGPPVDWLVLHSKRVIVVEPVSPRPGTLEDIDQRVKRMMRRPGDPPESDEAKRRRLAQYYLPITLTEGEDREYKIHVRFVKEIVYFEDLMLRRIDQLLDDREVRQAYDLLTALDQRAESWAGVVARRERLLSVEAAVKLDQGQPVHALALLEALHERNPKYSNLDVQFGTVVERLLTASLEARDPRAARYYLRRLARRYPNHRVVKEGTAQLIQRTRDLLAQAVTFERTGESAQAVDRAEEAARTWPDLAEVLPIYNRLAGRWQRLKVGVVDLPAADDGRSSTVLSAADRRRRQLTETPLFEPARLENKIVRYETQFFRDWEPTELGHSMLFRLRPYRSTSDSRPLVTAAGLAEALARRIEPRDAEYDARFAATVESLAVRSPFELTVRFRQVPLRPESLFAFPCSPFSGVQAALEPVSTDAANRAPAVAATWPFGLQSADQEKAVYRRSVPEPAGSSERHVSEIVELKFETCEKAIQALLRDEVSCLAHVTPWRIRSLQSRQEFFTQQYALPTTHLLQFNPHSRALTARTLRRALVYAIDRPQILRDVFLHEAPGKLGRLTSAPFATTSYAYNRAVEPHKYDSALAYSLARSAQKELGDEFPPLRLVAPPDPDIQAAVKQILRQWKEAGIEAQLVSPSAINLAAKNFGDWDVMYRTETLAEPLVDLWQFLALTPSTETGALGHLPMWLRQELLKLDRVGDWPAAERLLRQLHRQFWAEAYLVPLWELEDVLVYRKNVRGVPERPVAPYQKIERWKVEPWYSREQPL